MTIGTRVFAVVALNGGESVVVRRLTEQFGEPARRMVYMQHFEVLHPAKKSPVTFSAGMSWEAAQDIGGYKLKIPANFDPWLAITECLIGDRLDREGAAGFEAPGFEVLCMTGTLEELSKRPARSAAEIRVYLEGKVRAYWEHVQARDTSFGLADSLRLGVTVERLVDVARLGEDERWTITEGRREHEFSVIAMNEFLDKLPDRHVSTSSIARARPGTPTSSQQLDAREIAIANALDEALPYSANAYRQAIIDLGDTTRLSYGGIAAELREVVGAALRHLAPAEAVEQMPGYRRELGTNGPTMRQRARYILWSRHRSGATVEDSVEKFDDPAASVARSVYSRGSRSTHAPTDRSEVLNLAGYADAVLAELLNVHDSRPAT